MYKLNFKILLLLFIPVIISACDSDDGNDITPDERALEALVGEWRAVRVTKDDYELAAFENFRLVITPGQVFQTHGDTGLIFPIGNFEFVEGENYEMVVCNDVEVKLASDNGHLVASFTLDNQPSNGRQTGVNGGYVFDLVPNE